MSDTSPFARMHAVIAEDSQHMRTLLRSMLRALGFEHVSAESSGADALRQIHIELPDVVLLDWNMPGLTGIEVVQATKKMPDPFCRVPTMIVTGHASKVRLNQAKKLGVNAFLCKPVSIAALELRLRAIVGKDQVLPELPDTVAPVRKQTAQSTGADPAKTSRSRLTEETDTDLESFYV